MNSREKRRRTACSRFGFAIRFLWYFKWKAMMSNTEQCLFFNEQTVSNYRSHFQICSPFNRNCSDIIQTEPLREYGIQSQDHTGRHIFIMNYTWHTIYFEEYSRQNCVLSKVEQASCLLTIFESWTKKCIFFLWWCILRWGKRVECANLHCDNDLFIRLLHDLNSIEKQP